MDLFGKFLHAAGNGLDLRVGLAFAYDEPGRHAVLHGAEIHDTNAAALDLLYSVHNGSNEGIRRRSRCALGGIPRRGRVGTRIGLCLILFQRALK